jgi:hypothetical protein
MLNLSLSRHSLALTRERDREDTPVAIQPITYRPVTAIKPVSRKPDEEAVRKSTDRKPRQRDRPVDPALGENLDTLA